MGSAAGAGGTGDCGCGAGSNGKPRGWDKACNAAAHHALAILLLSQPRPPMGPLSSLSVDFSANISAGRPMNSEHFFASLSIFCWRMRTREGLDPTDPTTRRRDNERVFARALSSLSETIRDRLPPWIVRFVKL